MKRVICCLLCVAAVLALAACNLQTSASLTFQVETGDNVKVTLDTTDGASLTQTDGRFFVEQDGEQILTGVFLTPGMYDECYAIMTTASDVTILDEGEREGNAYLFYQTEGGAGIENDFLVKVANSNTGVLLGSLATQEQAKAAFEKLSLEIE